MSAPVDPADVAARNAADATLEMIHTLQGSFDNRTAVAAALAVAMAALGFVRDACGDPAAVAAAAMLQGAVEQRQDRARPSGEVC